MKFSDNDIGIYKQKHGVVFLYSVQKEENKEESLSAIIRDVTLDDIDYAQAVSKSNFGFKRALAMRCFVAGDNELLNDKKYAIGLISYMSELIDAVEGQLTKL